MLNICDSWVGKLDSEIYKSLSIISIPITSIILMFQYVVINDIYFKKLKNNLF